jgi:hypothetical protein
MHRSGASLLARALNLAGLRLFEPDQTRDYWWPKGSWETPGLSRASHELLDPGSGGLGPGLNNDASKRIPRLKEALEPYLGKAPTWGWKDPRLIGTWPLWRKALPPWTKARLVIAMRNPLDVALSLQEMHGFNIPKGLRICERFMESCLHLCSDQDHCLFFNFNAPDLIKELARLCKQLGLDAQPEAWGELYDPSLVHHRSDYAPYLPAYLQMHQKWAAQAGLDAALNIQNRDWELPALETAILLFRSQDAQNEGLLETCLKNTLEKSSSIFDFKIFFFRPNQTSPGLEDLVNRRRDRLEMLEVSEPPRDTDDNSIDRAHSLWRRVNQRYTVNNLIMMDSFAWPLRPHWDTALQYFLLEGKRLFAAWPDEQAEGAESVPNPIILGVAAKDLKRMASSMQPAPDRRRGFVGLIFDSIIGKYGSGEILRLPQTNQMKIHPSFGAVYGGVIYWQGEPPKKDVPAAGRLSADQIAWQGLKHNLATREKTLYRNLNYGSQAGKLALFDHFIDAVGHGQADDLLLQIARDQLESDPLAAHHIAVKLSAGQNLPPQLVQLLAESSARLGLSLDAQAWQRLLGLNPKGREPGGPPILDAEARRLLDQNTERLISLNRRHEGETVYLLGSGPQLNRLRPAQVEKLSRLCTIGLNRTQFILHPNYLISAYISELFLEMASTRTMRLHMRKNYLPPVHPGIVSVQRRLFEVQQGLICAYPHKACKAFLSSVFLGKMIWVSHHGQPCLLDAHRLRIWPHIIFS